MSCKSDTGALYTCTEGDDPTKSKDCPSGACTTSKATMQSSAIFKSLDAADVYADVCECQGKDVICGSTFPKSCSLKANALYTCARKGEKPEEKEECPDGKCMVGAGENRCGEGPISDCRCNEDGIPVCGFDLNESCREKIRDFFLGGIYHCPDGANTKPEILKICPPGSICQTKPAPQGAACGGTSCKCTGTEEVCSDSFPADCPEIEPNSVYKCTESGKPELVKACEGGKVCLTVKDGGICVDDNCKCHKNGLVCGESFPLKCLLKATALYRCSKDGHPEFRSDCYPERCEVSKASMAAEAIFKKMEDDVCIAACKCDREGHVRIIYRL